MRRKQLLIASGVITLAGMGVFAARLLPEPANSPERNGIVYKANEPFLGCVAAYHKKTGRLFWYRPVYVVAYDCALEEDIQNVWITRLEVKGDRIVVTNECGYEYLLDMKTLDVKPATGPTVVHQHRL